MKGFPKLYAPLVPNVPCGVERVLKFKGGCFFFKFKFLMYRVELKVLLLIVEAEKRWGS